MKKTAIITLTYNQLELATKPYLESLYNFTNQNNFDLILVDNGSTDGTLEYIKEFSKKYNNITIIENSENLGYSKGNNIGIKVALEKDYEYIGLFNNDILFTTSWLDLSKKAFEQDEKLGLASPRINKNKKAKMNSLNYLDKYKKYLSRYKTDFSYDISSYFCCVIIKSEVFKKIGLLDENFTPAFYEDDDFIMRSLYAGYRCGYVNNAFIYHNHQTSSSKLPHVDELMQKNKEYFFDKHPLGKYIWEHKKTNIINDFLKYIGETKL